MVRAALVLLAAFGALALDGQAARADTLILVEVPGPTEAALRTSLAPWGVEIVVVDPAPAAYAPGALAAERGASFVVWRRGRELALYDGAAATEERRPLPAEDDDAAAAATALSIKTWMGLGPPPNSDLVCGLHDCPRPPPPRQRHWIVEAETGVRGDGSHQGGAALRYGLAAGYRLGRFEAGLRVELGMDVDGIGFGRQGTWSELLAGAWARAGWQVRRGLTVLPGVGIGVADSSFAAPRTGPGEPGDAASATGLALDAEVGARWQHGRFAIAGRVGATLVPQSQLLRSRSVEELVDGHLEPWLMAAASVDF